MEITIRISEDLAIKASRRRVVNYSYLNDGDTLEVTSTGCLELTVTNTGECEECRSFACPICKMGFEFFLPFEQKKVIPECNYFERSEQHGRKEKTKNSKMEAPEVNELRRGAVQRKNKDES